MTIIIDKVLAFTIEGYNIFMYVCMLYLSYAQPSDLFVTKLSIILLPPTGNNVTRPIPNVSIPFQVHLEDSRPRRLEALEYFAAKSIVPFEDHTIFACLRLSAQSYHAQWPSGPPSGLHFPNWLPLIPISMIFHFPWLVSVRWISTFITYRTIGTTNSVPWIMGAIPSNLS